MVDCRPAAGAPPHELHAAPNGGPPPPPENNHHNQINQVVQGGGGDMLAGAHTPAPAARVPTPAAAPALQYGPGMPAGGMGGMGGMYGMVGGGKLGGVLWVPPPAPHLPPPPHHVNPHVFKSVQPNGADLPMNDIPTLRYYFNLGVECMWAAYGPPPPRHYAPRDLAQDMQQMSLGERAPPLERHKPHAPPDKPPPGKQPARSLLGPRFNKRGNQDGNQGGGHNQNNKGHNNNNNMPNKGPNNRRNSHEVRGAGFEGGECPDAGLVPVPYLSYPPPVFPVHYYPVDSNDPGMMGMMGGVGYVNYEEGGEYVAPYYPPLYAPPAHHVPHLAHHAEHK